MKIEIKKPCQENWDKMSLAEKGRFCDVCSKNVQDFTNSSDEELISEISMNQDICGRFDKNQLNRNLHFSHVNRLFATFAVGLSLTSAGFVSAQKVEVDSAKIAIKETIPIIIGGAISHKFDDSYKPLYVINGKISKRTDFQNLDVNKIKKVEVLKDKNATDLYGEKGKNGAILIYTKKRFIKKSKK